MLFTGIVRQSQIESRSESLELSSTLLSQVEAHKTNPAFDMDEIIARLRIANGICLYGAVPPVSPDSANLGIAELLLAVLC